MKRFLYSLTRVSLCLILLGVSPGGGFYSALGSSFKASPVEAAGLSAQAGSKANSLAAPGKNLVSDTKFLLPSASDANLLASLAAPSALSLPQTLGAALSPASPAFPHAAAKGLVQEVSDPRKTDSQARSDASEQFAAVSGEDLIRSKGEVSLPVAARAVPAHASPQAASPAVSFYSAREGAEKAVPEVSLSRAPSGSFWTVLGLGAAALAAVSMLSDASVPGVQLASGFGVFLSAIGLGKARLPDIPREKLHSPANLIIEVDPKFGQVSRDAFLEESIAAPMQEQFQEQSATMAELKKEAEHCGLGGCMRRNDAVPVSAHKYKDMSYIAVQVAESDKEAMAQELTKQGYKVHESRTIRLKFEKAKGRAVSLDEVKKLLNTKPVEDYIKKKYGPSLAGMSPVRRLVVEGILKAGKVKKPDVLIAHIDSGIERTHPAFKGFDIEVMGEEDKIGHGTHTAGTIAALFPWARFLVVNVFPDGSGNTDDILRAFSKVKEAAAKAKTVSTNSWGDDWGDPSSPETAASVEMALKLLISMIYAAGNAGPGRDTMGTPAMGRANDSETGAPWLVSVSAHDINGDPASFTSQGYYSPFIKRNKKKFPNEPKDHPHIAAMGVDLNAPWIGGGMLAIDGTSMATPQISALEGLLLYALDDVPLDHRKKLSKIKLALLKNSKTSHPDYLLGKGTPDAGAALKDLLKEWEPLLQEIQPSSVVSRTANDWAIKLANKIADLPEPAFFNFMADIGEKLLPPSAKASEPKSSQDQGIENLRAHVRMISQNLVLELEKYKSAKRYLKAQPPLITKPEGAIETRIKEILDLLVERHQKDYSRFDAAVRRTTWRMSELAYNAQDENEFLAGLGAIHSEEYAANHYAQYGQAPAPPAPGRKTGRIVSLDKKGFSGKIMEEGTGILHSFENMLDETGAGLKDIGETIGLSRLEFEIENGKVSVIYRNHYKDRTLVFKPYDSSSLLLRRAQRMVRLIVRTPIYFALSVAVILTGAAVELPERLALSARVAALGGDYSYEDPFWEGLSDPLGGFRINPKASMPVRLARSVLNWHKGIVYLALIGMLAGVYNGLLAAHLAEGFEEYLASMGRMNSGRARDFRERAGGIKRMLAEEKEGFSTRLAAALFIGGTSAAVFMASSFLAGSFLSPLAYGGYALAGIEAAAAILALFSSGPRAIRSLILAASALAAASTNALAGQSLRETAVSVLNKTSLWLTANVPSSAVLLTEAVAGIAGTLWLAGKIKPALKSLLYRHRKSLPLDPDDRNLVVQLSVQGFSALGVAGTLHLAGVDWPMIGKLAAGGIITVGATYIAALMKDNANHFPLANYFTGITMLLDREHPFRIGKVIDMQIGKKKIRGFFKERGMTWTRMGLLSKNNKRDKKRELYIANRALSTIQLAYVDLPSPRKKPARKPKK